MVRILSLLKNVEAALLFVNMADNVINAKTVEALLFVNMGDNALVARNVAAGSIGRCPKCPLEHSSVLLLGRIFSVGT